MPYFNAKLWEKAFIQAASRAQNVASPDPRVGIGAQVRRATEKIDAAVFAESADEQQMQLMRAADDLLWAASMTLMYARSLKIKGDSALAGADNPSTPGTT